ncbi:hypothetical protein LQ567_16930 [Niabella pedocola]|uniref:Type II secretion system protein GspC N-terminal domain-containing protein n=1 Tax=Niabella pedocola TaxID=1752077 RepID=A0ABS8PTQ8_9BACT|nr:hypothetical protein [Niabella pedocola]MCD2424467.1 hypothetical protein [Niabella pedocola]
MKNNPNMKYLLIGLVALIWGLIIYKVIRGLSGDDPPPVATKIKPPQTADTLSAYQLTAASYPDPFSNELIEEEVVTETITPGGAKAPAGITPANPQPAPVMAAPPPPPPPAIKYSGYIYNPQTRKKMAMITVNGRGLSVSINEKIDDKTRVLDITDQKITVSFNGKRIEYVIGG